MGLRRQTLALVDRRSLLTQQRKFCNNAASRSSVDGDLRDTQFYHVCVLWGPPLPRRCRLMSRRTASCEHVAGMAHFDQVSLRSRASSRRFKILIGRSFGAFVDAVSQNPALSCAVTSRLCAPVFAHVKQPRNQTSRSAMSTSPICGLGMQIVNSILVNPGGCRLAAPLKDACGTLR